MKKKILQLHPKLVKYEIKLEEFMVLLNQLRDEMYGKDMLPDPELKDTPINIIDLGRTAINLLQKQMYHWKWRNDDAKTKLATTSP